MHAATPIRRARPEDLPALLGLVREFCAIDGHDYEEARVATALEPLLSDDAHGQVWISADDGGALGYVVVTWGWSIESGGREALVDEIYVRDRNRGLGGEMLEVALDHARRSGARRVFLESERHNERVRRFYARHGFATDDSVWMHRDLSATSLRDAP